MENGNMAPPGAYESQEARAAQPTTTTAPQTSAAVDTSATSPPAAPTNTIDDVNMNARGDDDASHPAHAAASTDDASMDQESKHETGGDAHGVDDTSVVVNLKFLHRDRVTLRCAPTIAIAELKQLVRDVYLQAIQQDEAGSQASQQHEPQPTTQPLRLIYKGKVLKDDQTLASYNFLNEDTIHAIFSRPPPTSSDDGAPSGEAATHNNNGSNGSAEAHGGDSDHDDGSSVFVFETDSTAPVPEISRIISSIVHSALNGSENNDASATIRIFPFTPQGNGPNESVHPATAGTNTPASTTPSPAAPVQRSASVAPTSANNTTTQSVGLTTQSTVPTAPAPAPAPAAGPTTAALLNQAAALRRSIPALELAPLSRPSDLSEDMYALGNAIRESGDTYLAIHRQLQFVATRFLQENHLSTSERARLRGRVQQLIPVMDNVGQMSTAVSRQLANSPYGVPSAPMHQRANVDASSPAQRQGGLADGESQQPQFLHAIQSLVSEALGSAGGGPTPHIATPLNQVLNGLPAFLSSLNAVGGAQRNTESQPASRPHSAQPAPSGGNSSQTPPFRSFTPQLAGIVVTNPALVNATLDEFLRVALPAIDEHIVRYYSTDPEAFVQNGVAEVENALRIIEQAHNREYTAQESRRSIIRLAMQELAQISMPIATSLQARSTDMQAWMRRSVSHLFAELSEIAPAGTAAKMTSYIVKQILSGNDQSFADSWSPFLDRVATETFKFLQRRFQFAHGSVEIHD